MKVSTSPSDEPRAMVKVFSSYSHLDHRHQRKLEVALSLLVRQGLIESFYDRLIAPGQDWAETIARQLEEADLVLLLVSPDFIASDYCYGREMNRALERHRIGSAIVIPIIMRPTDWKTAPFAHLQALPENGKPVSLWRNRDAALEGVVASIRALATSKLRLVSPAAHKRLHLFPRQRNQHYTGREDTLASLRERYRVDDDRNHVQLLTGLGGYGKTETALEYAYRNRGDYDVILWFRADNEAALRTDMLASARALGLGTLDDTNTDAAVSACRSWLESHGRWLAIFDNADDLSILAGYLPQSASGHVLVTSRAVDVELVNAAAPIALEPLTADVAAAFLLGRTNARGRVGDAAAAPELARELGGLPLALEQAAACIVALGTTTSEYLQSYRIRRLALLNEFGPVTGDHRASIATTWTMNFEEVQRKSPAAADTLRACAFMVPDGIPVEVFARGATVLGDDIARALGTAVTDPLAVLRLLQPLRKYSLITYERETKSVTIHRLVQEVLISTMDADTRRLWRRRSVDAVRAAFPIERLSPSASIVHVTHALQTVGSSGDIGRQQELALLALLGPALIATHGYASGQVGDVYRRASSLLRTGDPALTRFQTMWGLWAFSYVRARLPDARRLAARLERHALGAAVRRDRSGYLLEALRASASTSFSQGHVGSARTQFKRALTLYDGSLHESHAHSFAVNPSVVCWSYLAVCELLVAGADAGLQACDVLMNHATAQTHVFSRVYACFWAACSHQLRGDVQRARQAAEDGLALSRQMFPQWDAMNEIVRAWCVARQEDPAHGAELLQAALNKHEKTGARTIRPYFLLLLGDALLLSGATAAGVDALDDALATAARTGEQTWTAAILHRQALAGPARRVPALLKKAATIARGQRTRTFEAVAAAQLRALDRGQRGSLTR